MSLAAEVEDGNGLQLEKLRLNFSIFFSARLQIIDIDGSGLISLCELRLYLPLDVQRKCSEWIYLSWLPLLSRVVLGPKICEIPVT